MLAPNFHGSFKKERKLMQKRNKDMDKLNEVLALLINEQPLLPKHENHPLHGRYKGWWECHVETTLAPQTRKSPPAWEIQGMVGMSC